MSAPQMNETWGRLFGVVEPPKLPVHEGEIPPVSHALYGIQSHGGTSEQRRAKRDARMNGEVAYLKAHGPLMSSQLAKAFGIGKEAMINDLRLLAEGKRIRRANSQKPFLWEAV